MDAAERLAFYQDASTLHADGRTIEQASIEDQTICVVASNKLGEESQSLDKQTIELPVRDSLQSIQDALDGTIFRHPTLTIKEETIGPKADKEAHVIY